MFEKLPVDILPALILGPLMHHFGKLSQIQIVVDQKVSPNKKYVDSIARYRCAQVHP